MGEMKDERSMKRTEIGNGNKSNKSQEFFFLGKCVCGFDGYL